MGNQQLLDYIKQSIQNGKSREEIKQTLLENGWTIEDIIKAFNLSGFDQSFTDSTTSLPDQSQDLTLPGIGSLLKRTFSVYGKKLRVFLGIMLISVIFGALSLIIAPLGLVNTLLSVVFWLIAIIVGFWVSIALIFVIKDKEEKIGTIEAFRISWHKLIPFIWVSVLAFLTTIGGFILLIIPWIIFLFWFVFSTYVLVCEDIRGMNALFRSKQLVTGYWWKVFGRFFIMNIFVFLVFLLIGFISFLLLPLLGEIIVILLIFSIFTLFFIPFITVFSFLLYEDLKKQKAKIVFESPKKRTRVKFILVAILALLSILITSFISIMRHKEQADIEIMWVMSRIEDEIGFHYSVEGSYDEINCAYPTISHHCDTIRKITGREPIIHSSQNFYCGYVKLSLNRYYCMYNKNSYITSINPGTSGYCDGTTFICPPSEVRIQLRSDGTGEWIQSKIYWDEKEEEWIELFIWDSEKGEWIEVER